eukprot:gene19995-26708_t
MNPSAPEFIPALVPAMSKSQKKRYNRAQRVAAQTVVFAFCEEDVSPEELLELEAADDWVALQAELELEEQEHIKLFALQNAPASIDWEAIDWTHIPSVKAQ